MIDNRRLTSRRSPTTEVSEDLQEHYVEDRRVSGVRLVCVLLLDLSSAPGNIRWNSHCMVLKTVNDNQGLVETVFYLV